MSESIRTVASTVIRAGGLTLGGLAGLAIVIAGALFALVMTLVLVGRAPLNALIQRQRDPEGDLKAAPVPAP